MSKIRSYCRYISPISTNVQGKDDQTHTKIIWCEKKEEDNMMCFHLTKTNNEKDND